MGKITYTFDTNDPDDAGDITIHAQARGMWNVLWDLDQHLRSLSKYPKDGMTDEAMEQVDEIWTELHELLGMRNVILDV